MASLTGLSRLRAAVRFRAADEMAPPRRQNFNVDGASAAEYRRNLELNRRGNLRILQTAHELYVRRRDPVGGISLLDFGCAFSPIGQAYVLDAALAPRIQAYLGIDIDPAAIVWCEQITRRRSEFEYRHYEADHERYFELGAGNPVDTVRLADFRELRTVLEGRQFEIQLSTSVFTHLYLHELETFLELVTPHMTVGGILFNSVFLLDPALDADWTARSRFCKPDRKFVLCTGGDATAGSYTYAPHNPRAGIGYAQSSVIAAVARAKGLVLEGFLYGDWRGVQRLPLSPTYQDWVILRRR